MSKSKTVAPAITQEMLEAAVRAVLNANSAKAPPPAKKVVSSGPRKLPATLTFHNAKDDKNGRPFIVFRVDAEGFRPAYVTMYATGD